MFLKKRPSAFLRVRNTYCNVKKGISQLVFYYHLSKNKLKRCDAPIGEITKPYRTRKLHHRQRSVMEFFIIESLSRSVKIVNGHSQIISGDRYKSGRLKMWLRFLLDFENAPIYCAISRRADASAPRDSMRLSGMNSKSKAWEPSKAFIYSRQISTASCKGNFSVPFQLKT